jgi:hypothetical protein
MGRVARQPTADMARITPKGDRNMTYPQDLYMSCMEDVECAINIHDG